MKSLSIVPAFLLSAAAGLAGIAAAMPPPDQVAGNPMVIPVNGCHSDIRNHYVAEFGRSMLHFHRGEDCTPVAVSGSDEPRRSGGDCHRSVRTHRVDGVRLRHRHVGPDCSIREVRQGGRP